MSARVVSSTQLRAPSASALRARPRSVARATRVVTAARLGGGKLPYWDIQWDVLNAKGVETVGAELASNMVESGDYVFIDVRPQEDYQKAHPKGAINVPLFQRITFENFTAASALKSIALLANGVTPIEMNPKFAESIKEVAADKPVLVFCETGGTMKPTVNFPTGKESRSLKACYRIVNEDLASSAVHLDMGCYGWFQAGLEFEGEYDTSNVGRSPNAAASPEGFEVSPKQAANK